ncbi:MAG: CobD/CbiB family protein, partial [Thermoplasmataceae archaeon]
MIYEYIIIPAEGFLLAITIDILFGEPRPFIHISRISGGMTKTLQNDFRNKGKSKIWSFLLLFIPSISILIPSIIALNFLNYGVYSPVVIVFLYALILTSTFRITSIGSKLKPVINYLEKG